MTFSIETWLIGKGLGVAFETLLKKDVRDRLTQTIQRWAVQLPNNLALDASSLQPIVPAVDSDVDKSVRAHGSSLALLSEVFRHREVPSAELWLQVLLERRNHLCTKGADTPFYLANEQQVRPHLEVLAQNLRGVILDDQVFGARHIQQELSTLRQLLAGDTKAWLHEYESYSAKGLTQLVAQRFQLTPDWVLHARVLGRDPGVSPIAQVFAFWAGDIPHSPPLEPLSFLHTVETNDIVLAAPGGFGKTSFLLRLALRARADRVVFFFDLSGIGMRSPANTHAETPAELARRALVSDRNEDITRLQSTLRADGFDKLLIVDGLNENTFFDAESVITFFSNLRSSGTRTTLVVGDRLVQRAAYDKFVGATMVPFDEAFIRSRLSSDHNTTALGRLVGTDFDGWRPLLETPFFLDLATKVATSKDQNTETLLGRAGLVGEYFADQCGDLLSEQPGVDREWLSPFAEGAAAWYRTIGGVVAPTHEAQALLRIDASGMDSLIARGLLVRSPGEDSVRFKHQLFHDYLVGAWLALDQTTQVEERWTAREFSVATLGKGGFDALEFAAELLPMWAPEQQRLGDAFLREVYDWDYSATLKIMARLALAGAIDVISPQMRLSTRLLNMEKRWDKFKHTADRILRELSLIPFGMLRIDNPKPEIVPWDSLPDISALCDACSNHPLFGAALDEHSGGYWLAWRDLFCRQTPFTANDLRYLSVDPLFGWTAANVCRRVGGDNGVFDNVRLLYTFSRETSESSSRSAMARWRLVHLLGVDRRDSTFGFLVEIIKDSGTRLKGAENEYVRYGAVRSALEILSTWEESDLKHGMTLLRDSVKISFGAAPLDDRARQRIGMQLQNQTMLNGNVVTPPGRWSEEVALLAQLGQELQGLI